MRNVSLTILLAILLSPAVLPSPVLAQCSTRITNDDELIAIRSFGWLFVENIEVVYGQSFLIDCDAQLLHIEATIVPPNYSSDGHPPMVQGDVVVCTVFDSNKEPIMAEQNVVQLPDVVQKIGFDFSAHEFKLAAGQYYFMLSSPADRWCFIYMGTEYSDGASQLDMLGSWIEQSGDSMFNIQLDPDSAFVAAEERSWGAIKGLYR